MRGAVARHACGLFLQIVLGKQRRRRLSEQAPSVCFLRRVPVLSRVDASLPAVGIFDVTAGEQ